MSNYRIEFPEYDDVLMLSNDWIDSSWHNDVSPSFEKQIGEIKYKIWCDFKDPDRREVGGKQFTVTFYDKSEFEELQDLAEFDTLQEALDFVNKETTK
jgi:hypothetical protein